MSAQVCSDETINALAQLAPERFGAKQAIADLLIAENMRSFNYRYAHRGEESTEPVTYEASAEVRSMTAIAIVKLCDYYDYQACETDDYEESEAARVIDAIRREALERAADELLVEQDRLLLGTKAPPGILPPGILLPGQRLDVARRDGDWGRVVKEARHQAYLAAPWGL